MRTFFHYQMAVPFSPIKAVAGHNIIGSMENADETVFDAAP